MRNLLCIIAALLITTSAFAGEFSLKSSVFHDMGKIPVLYSCNGENISPPLTWENAPPNTKSFVLILSAPYWINTEVYLWILYNIPGEVKGLEQGAQYLPGETLMGTNFYDEVNYRGPCPPDARERQYVFTLYALDVVLFPIENEIDPEKLLVIIKPHILKQTKLTGVFSH